MMILRLSFIFACFLVHKSQESALHGPCLSNDDCGTIDTYCKNQTCVCRENFAVWYDSCVQMPSPPLRCTKKMECHTKLGARSMCNKKGQCACKPFHHLHLGQCVKNRDLHEQCDHDHQCYCGADCGAKIACIHKNCTCKPGHVPYKIRRCIEDPSYIDLPDESLLSTTVHKHKSVHQNEHKSNTHGEHNSTTHSEPKTVQVDEKTGEQQEKAVEQQEKDIELQGTTVEQQEKINGLLENAVEPSVERAFISSANVPIFGQHLVAIFTMVAVLNL